MSSSSIVYCQGGGKAIRSSGFSSVLTERSSSTLVGDDHAAAVIDAGSLVLSPNGNKGQSEISIKDFDSYGGTTSSSLVEIQEGIGIVKFLGGKGFFITGATGFLAKGINHFSLSIHA